MHRTRQALAPAAAVLMLACLGAAVSIDECGAVREENTTAAAMANSAAIVKCFLVANSSAEDRVVVVPAGAVYFIMNSTASGLFNVTLRVSGRLVLNNNIGAWPWSPAGDYSVGAIEIVDSQMIVLDGGGVLDGQGYMWWLWAISGGFDDRPTIVHMVRCTDVIIRDLYATNSPTYHFNLEDMENALIHNITVYVDVDAQQGLLGERGLLDPESGLPLFPLNTDGIDFSGVNAWIHNISIENFDDTVCMKPLNGANRSPCTSNVTVTALRVKFGVGASIGSVPPDPNCNCIANILYEDVSFESPFKAIYVKPNPGTVGTGLIANITYRHLTVHNPLWYAIWISTQQQTQPGGGADTGCSFFFPLDPVCPTDPLVTVRDIVVDGFTSTGGITLPGVIMCNSTNPCTGIVFRNVSNAGHFSISDQYYCENAVVTNEGTNNPPVSCGPNGGRFGLRAGERRRVRLE